MVAGVFEELLIADNKLLKEHENPGGYNNILDNFAKRVNLYKDFAEKEHNPIIKAIIEARKSVVMSDMDLLATQYEIQSNIAKIISRLDALEENISRT